MQKGREIAGSTTKCRIYKNILILLLQREVRVYQMIRLYYTVYSKWLLIARYLDHLESDVSVGLTEAP